MASEKILQQKQAYVEQLAEKLNSSVAGVVVSYKGISVADDTMLRRKMREAGVEYSDREETPCCALRLRKRSASTSWTACWKAPTALAVSAGDHVAAAKILCEYAEKNKSFEIKAGFVEGKVINKAEVEELAKMPPKEVLVAKVLGGLNAPITGFVGVLHANLRGLVCALNAIAEKQSA